MMDKTKNNNNPTIQDFKVVKNEQLDLFLLTDPKEDKDYSHLVELYDLIPKNISGKHKRIDGKFLQAVMRKFSHRGSRYSLTVKPARITTEKDGVIISEKDCFPGTREELIEDALRKIACEGAGLMLADDYGEELGVKFTLYGLQKELKDMGHTFSITEIKEGLMVGAQTMLDLRSSDGKDILLSPMFSTVGISDRDDWENKGKKAKAFVRFNPLVSRSIKGKTYRQFSYAISMKFKSSLARYLHKRLSILYRQASRIDPYTIMLTTIVEDSGMVFYKSLGHNDKQVRQAFDELIEKEVLSSYIEIEADRLIGKNNKLLDKKYQLYPHAQFIKNMRRFNAKAKELEESR